MPRARNKDDVPWWVWPLLIFGGVGAAALLVDAADKAKPVYQCWNCKRPLSLYQSPCPHCGADNVWNRG
jgi:hypothetical protein